MLAFLFAVISLTNIDPEAIVTPAPIVRSTTGVGSGFAPGDASLPSAFAADIEVAPVCTFGLPRFGSDLWGDASALSRTLAPPCAGATSPLGTGGFDTFGFPSFASELPWLLPTSGGVVRLTEPGLHAVNVSNNVVRSPITSAIRAMPQPPREARPVEPAVLGARAVEGPRTTRSH